MNLISCKACGVVHDKHYTPRIPKYIEVEGGDFEPNPNYPEYFGAEIQFVWVCSKCGCVNGEQPEYS